MNIYPLQNKYYNWYNNIILKAKVRNWTKKIAPDYVERHHIIPKCLGGTDDKDNIVYLTAKEHIICHLLLTKCYEGEAKKKMCFAFHIMSVKKHNSKYYEIGRKLHSESVSGNNHPMFGKTGAFKGKKHTPDQLTKMSYNNKGSKNPRAKINEDDIIYIRQQLDLGVKNKTLCIMFDISPSHMSAIKHSTRW